jgi:hypothetical protein
MNQVQQVASLIAPGLVLILVAIVFISGFKQGWIGQFIVALNSLNTPWVAIIVVILGMLYNLKCKAFGLPSDSANQVIGGGLGLLTGQALSNRRLPDAAVVPGATPNADPPKENP